MSEDIVPKGIEEILKLAEDEGYIEIVKEEIMSEEERLKKLKEENERIKKEFIEEQTYKDFYKELVEKWETLAKSISERNKSLKKEIEELKEEIDQINKNKWEDWLEKNE